MDELDGDGRPLLRVGFALAPPNTPLHDGQLQSANSVRDNLTQLPKPISAMNLRREEGQRRRRHVRRRLTDNAQRVPRPTGCCKRVSSVLSPHHCSSAPENIRLRWIGQSVHSALARRGSPRRGGLHSVKVDARLAVDKRLREHGHHGLLGGHLLMFLLTRLGCEGRRERPKEGA